MLGLCLSGSAQARRWHWWGGYEGRWGYEGNTARSQESEAPAPSPAAPTRPAAGGVFRFGDIVDRLARGCLQHAAELQNLPFDAIVRIAALDETQSNALDALRAAVASAAQRLTADCPREAATALSARLDAANQSVEAAVAAFDGVRPALQAFYRALDDEQKARLYRDLGPGSAATARAESTPERSRRRVRGEPTMGAWVGICEDLTATLRNWPIQQVERDVGLSDDQRVAFYDLVTASLKEANALKGNCPAEDALTPPRRMDVLQARLIASRQAAAAIRSPLAGFYQMLNGRQKTRFAGAVDVESSGPRE